MLKQISEWPRWLRDVTPPFLWMILIFILSHQSRLMEIEGKFIEHFIFKLAHVTVYAVLTWLLWRALAPHRQARWKLLALAWGLATLYGISDEFHQSYIPGRFGRLSDVLFDAGGALLMVLLLRRLIWLRLFPECRPVRLSEHQSTWNQV